MSGEMNPQTNLIRNSDRASGKQSCKTWLPTVSNDSERSGRKKIL